MLDRILGHDIATYVKAHRGLIILTIILSTLSSLFVIVPAYLLQPFVDEGMKMASDPVEWRIPGPTFQSNWSIERTELVLVTGISPNRLLILLKSTLLDLIPHNAWQSFAPPSSPQYRVSQEGMHLCQPIVQMKAEG